MAKTLSITRRTSPTVTASTEATIASTLALETSSSRMHRLGRGLLTLGEIPTVDAIVAAVDAVTVGDVRRVIDRVFATDEQVLSVVGPLDAAELAAG